MDDGSNNEEEREALMGHQTRLLLDTAFDGILTSRDGAVVEVSDSLARESASAAVQSVARATARGLRGGFEAAIMPLHPRLLANCRTATASVGVQGRVLPSRIRLLEAVPNDVGPVQCPPPVAVLVAWPIADHARLRCADIVMATHGRGGLRSTSLRSLTMAHFPAGATSARALWFGPGSSYRSFLSLSFPWPPWDSEGGAGAIAGRTSGGPNCRAPY